MPPTEVHDWLNSAIYDELVHGQVEDDTRRRVVEISEELWDRGAKGLLLGCTEIELLIRQADVELPVFPCTSRCTSKRRSTALSTEGGLGSGRRPGSSPSSTSAASSRRSSLSCCSGTSTAGQPGRQNV